MRTWVSKLNEQAVDVRDIRISIVDNEAVLSGTVARPQDKALAETILQLSYVRNDLSIGQVTALNNDPNQPMIQLANDSPDHEKNHQSPDGLSHAKSK